MRVRLIVYPIIALMLAGGLWSVTRDNDRQCEQTYESAKDTDTISAAMVSRMKSVNEFHDEMQKVVDEADHRVKWLEYSEKHGR